MSAGSCAKFLTKEKVSEWDQYLIFLLSDEKNDGPKLCEYLTSSFENLKT